MVIYWIIFGGIALLSWLIQNNLQSKFDEYSKTPISMTGKEVAEKMLHDNGIYDVKVMSVSGKLTDHYDPTNKTLNLSDVVYNCNNVAAAAVAAHECGHAVQHATAYSFLKMRSAMVPAVQFSSQWMQWVLLGGMLLINIFPQLLLIGILMFAMTTLFSFVTLPVEIDASKRAVNWLEKAGITTYQTTPMATGALRAAAYTYVVAALGSLANLLYYVMIYMKRR